MGIIKISELPDLILCKKTRKLLPDEQLTHNSSWGLFFVQLVNWINLKISQIIRSHSKSKLK